MKATDEQLGLTRQDLEALQRAFAHFGEQTAALRQAYARLQREVERANLELEAANRELERKVRALDELNNFLRAILESIPAAVVVTDLRGVIQAYNSAAEQMWGVPAPHAIGRPFQEVMGSHGGLLAGVLAGGDRQENVRRELQGSRPRVISSTACLVHDSGGRSIGAVQVDRDITQVCELESRLRHNEKLAELGRMAAGLAHEIRKPLNGIKGFASLLLRQVEEDPIQARYVGNIVDAADRLNGMLGRVLDFARPDALRPVSLDLRMEALAVAEFVRAEEQAAGARIEVSVPEEARFVTADRDKLRQVLFNLLKNGVEALTGPGLVELSAQLDGAGGVRVCIRDTGRGIEPDKMDKVLEPFYTDKPGGTGLGLAIVARILELHGTRLQIASRLGAGTAVAFVLPAAMPPEGA